MKEKPMDTAAADLFLDHFGLSPRRLDLAALGELAGAFSRIPWENLTKYLARAQDPAGPERLRMPLQVFEEYLGSGAGGTCFSLTRALAEVLDRCGYRCRPAMADMSHGPDIHCGLLVELHGRRVLMDPGYLVPVPVPLRTDAAVETAAAGQVFRYVPDGRGGWDMYTIRGGEERWRYRLKGESVGAVEFEEHWRRSFHATGMNSLHLSRLTDGGRLYAHNGNLRVLSGGTRRNEKMDADYPAAVAESFGLDRELARRAWEELQRTRRAWS
jgi:arylamine N-acetyltransferase